MSERDDAARADHDRFGEWDAAYLLGALSRADRRAYEEHLATCPLCSGSVADLAGLPALLSAVPTEQALALLDPPSPVQTPDLVPVLARRVRRTRRIRRWSLAGGLVAAAVAATVFVSTQITRPDAPTVATSLQQVAGKSVPLTAEVTFTEKGWGTEVNMVCTWKGKSVEPYPGAAKPEYGLWVITTAGSDQRVATWSAGPGDVVRANGSTAVPVDQVARVEVRTADGDTPLLSAAVHHS